MMSEDKQPNRKLSNGVNFSQKHCVPCEGGVMPLFRTKAEEYLKDIPGWSLSEDAKKISKTFTFKNFKEALAFANRVGGVAEAERHHPDMLVGWGKVGITLTTHAIGGLSENDFIIAAKIDEL